MDIAVIKTGGKQYKVKKDDIINVELLQDKKNAKLEFEDILGGKKVEAQIIEETKGPKILNIKFKNKTRYTKRIGHRQKLIKIKITNIS